MNAKGKIELNEKNINAILGQPFFPKTLETRHNYTSSHDDNDGDPYSGMIDVCITSDGDVHLKTFHKGFGGLRFRTGLGGGRYPKTRNALLLLAEAIRQEGFDKKESK